MSAADTVKAIIASIEKRVAASTPFRATVSSLSAGKVLIVREGTSTPDTQAYARLTGFALAVNDEVLCINLAGQAVVLGRIQRAAPTAFTLDAPLILGATKISYGTSRPETVVTGSVGDLYIQTDGVGRRIEWIKASGAATTTGWTPIAAPSSFHEQGWRQLLVNPGAITVSSPGWAAGPTITATLTNGDDADGTMLIHTTGASSGDDSGMRTTFDQTQRRWNPVLIGRIKTQASIANIRLWFGLTDANLNGSATPTARHATFGYDTGRDGTAFWRCLTDNNTGTPTTTATTVAIATATSYRMRIEIDNDNTEVRFYIDDVLVARHTSNFPSAGTGLGVTLDVSTLTNATRAIGWGRVALGQK